MRHFQEYSIIRDGFSATTGFCSFVDLKGNEITFFDEVTREDAEFAWRKETLIWHLIRALKLLNFCDKEENKDNHVMFKDGKALADKIKKAIDEYNKQLKEQYQDKKVNVALGEDIDYKICNQCKSQYRLKYDYANGTCEILDSCKCGSNL